VARPDALLDETASTLTSQFPDLEMRKVAVDLGTREGPNEVKEAIADIECPQVCFLNAGYIQTGFFNQTPLEKHLANLDCNVGHVLALSHLLTNRCAQLGWWMACQAQHAQLQQAQSNL
jgi:short-subunit dehydrogenase